MWPVDGVDYSWALEEFVAFFSVEGSSSII
jgi:hypothetical protein